MPQLSVVYISSDFKTELHSFFQNSVRRPVTHHHSSMLSCSSVALPIEVTVQQSGKISFLTIASCVLLFVYDSSAVDIMPKLKRNI